MGFQRFWENHHSYSQEWTLSCSFSHPCRYRMCQRHDPHHLNRCFCWLRKKYRISRFFCRWIHHGRCLGIRKVYRKHWLLVWERKSNSFIWFFNMKFIKRELYFLAIIICKSPYILHEMTKLNEIKMVFMSGVEQLEFILDVILNTNIIWHGPVVGFINMFNVCRSQKIWKKKSLILIINCLPSTSSSRNSKIFR